MFSSLEIIFIPSGWVVCALVVWASKENPDGLVQVHFSIAVSDLRNIWVFSSLVPSKREKNVSILLSLYIFWGKCVYFSIKLKDIHFSLVLREREEKKPKYFAPQAPNPTSNPWEAQACLWAFTPTIGTELSTRHSLEKLVSQKCSKLKKAFQKISKKWANCSLKVSLTHILFNRGSI